MHVQGVLPACSSLAEGCLGSRELFNILKRFLKHFWRPKLETGEGLLRSPTFSPLK